MPLYRRILQAGDTPGAATSAELAAAVALLQDKATAATDTELAAAVTTINAALTGKQDASVAATDAELAAAVATLQSASTAATDAELSAAVATINTALGLKQDASTAATDVEVAALGNIYARNPLGIWAPAGWGYNMRAALALAGSARAVVGVMGDSIPQGIFTSAPRAKSVPALFAADLIARWGDGGSGFLSSSLTRNAVYESTNPVTAYAAGTLVDATGTWTAFTGTSSSIYRLGTDATSGFNDGPSSSLLANTASNAAAGPYNAGTLTFNKIRGTKVRVAYNNNTAQAFTVIIDGGAPQTVNPTSTATIATVEYTVAAGDHTVVITPSSTVSFVGIYGVWGYNATGALVNNYSRWGATAGAFAPASSPYGHPSDWSGGPSDPNPAHLLIYTLGGNDASASVSVDTYISKLRTTLARIRESAARSGAVDLLLLAPHLGPTFDPAFVYASYINRLRGVAEAYGAALVNLWAIYRNNWTYANSLGYWSAADATGNAGSDQAHPSDVGNADAYARIKSGLLLPAGLL